MFNVSPRTLSTVTAMLALVPFTLAGCGLPDADTGGSSANLAVRPRGMMPLRDELTPVVGSLVTSSAPSGSHLSYFGGRVVSNVQVVQVLYGGGSYLPQVTSTATPSMATFYQQLTNSAQFDGLAEYATSGGAHANQAIGRGSFSRQVQITPSAANNGSTISDASIQAELTAQITAGNLPAPTTDGAGNNNTYYAVFFPHGKSITQGGESSCVPFGFCAYHGTIGNAGGHEVYYGVHPDMQPGSGCDVGCGTGTSFANYQSVASHELVEMVTDPEVGLATTFAPPLAWYDSQPQHGEIGDLCNAQQGTFVGSDGQAYTAQKEFSNSQNDCVVAAPSVAWTSPAVGSPLAGTASLTVQANDVTSVWFDGYYASNPSDITTVGWHRLGSAMQISPGTWVFAWNTATIPDQGNPGWGTVNVVVGASDTHGHQLPSLTQHYRRWDLYNGPGRIGWVSPAASTLLAGTAALTASASNVSALWFDGYYATNPADITTVGWHRLGSAVAGSSGTWVLSWNTHTIPNQGNAGWGTVNVVMGATDTRGVQLPGTLAYYHRFDIKN